ncbi:MAG TPA: Rieske (2Fe-2S) protein [Chryseolinea sp.]|nr:Rieske (2Fe-2S) protein [Chryseolinea sp.]
MNRKEFVVRCGAGCLAMLATPGLLASCAGPKYLTAPIEGSFMVVPRTAFEIVADDASKTYRRYVIVENESLEYPICLYRKSDDLYQALWMKCTHQGTELHVFGEKLQCPAHGSEFTSSGAVQNGPAAQPLRTFEVIPSDAAIKISLR